jgi:hypothetical protein
MLDNDTVEPLDNDDPSMTRASLGVSVTPLVVTAVAVPSSDTVEGVVLVVEVVERTTLLTTRVLTLFSADKKLEPPLNIPDLVLSVEGTVVWM